MHCCCCDPWPGDCLQCVRLLEPPPGASIAPLLAVAPAGTTVADTWVTGFSSREQQHAVQHTHVAVLSDASAWLFHLEAGCWLSLQPGRADLAGQAPHPGLGGIALAGDAERLRRGVSEAVRRSGCPARPPLPAECDAVWKRKEAELALWRSTLLGDAEGYKRWLALLANLLAQHKDVVGDSRGRQHQRRLQAGARAQTPGRPCPDAHFAKHHAVRLALHRLGHVQWSDHPHCVTWSAHVPLTVVMCVLVGCIHVGMFVRSQYLRSTVRCLLLLLLLLLASTTAMSETI